MLALKCLVFLPLTSSILGLSAPQLPSQAVRLFLASENHTLPNHAMVNGSRFRVDDIDVMDGISDAIWCQAAPSLGVVHYQWYGPGGLDDPVELTTTLSNASEISESTTFVVVEDDQVGLARPSGPGIGDNEGFYQCVITVNEIRHTLVVGVYKTSSYNNNTGPVVNSPVQFSLISPRDADPPQFTLSFNVSNAPATTVNCSVNNEQIENMSVSRDILNGEPPTLTEVTVTIRQRSSGVYNCTMSNARVEDGTITVNGANVTASPGFATVALNVTGTPTNVVLSANTLSWAAPATPVSGYEVFYVTAAGETHSAGNTTDTNLTVSGLSDVCSVFVVTYGGDSLPSARSNTISFNVSLCESVADIISSAITVTSFTTSDVATNIASTSVPCSPVGGNFSFVSVGVIGGLLLLSIIFNIILTVYVVIKRKTMKYNKGTKDNIPVNQNDREIINMQTCPAYGSHTLDEQAETAANTTYECLDDIIEPATSLEEGNKEKDSVNPA